MNVNRNYTEFHSEDQQVWEYDDRLSESLTLFRRGRRWEFVYSSINGTHVRVEVPDDDMRKLGYCLEVITSVLRPEEV